MHLWAHVQRVLLTPLGMDRQSLTAWTVVVLLLFAVLPGLLEYVRVTMVLAALPGPKKAHWVRVISIKSSSYHALQQQLFGVTEGMKRPHQIHRLNLAWSRTVGPITACRVLYRRIVVVYDPVLLHKILSAKDANKPDRPYNSLTRVRT